MTPPIRPETPWHAQHPPEGWQGILQQALQDFRRNPQDAEAMQAIRDANEALNTYDQEGVDQSKLSSIPGELSTVGKGMTDAIKGMPAGIGQMLHHAREGEFVNVGKDIVGGLTSTAKGALAPWELAMRELGGEQVSSNERSSMLSDAGGSLIGLEAMALPGQIGRGVKAIRGGGVTMPRPLSGPSEGTPGAPIKPKPVDLTKLDENQFMEEYRKGTMTPDQADPYGLNEPGTVPKPPKPLNGAEYLTNKDLPYFDPEQPLHDLLTPAQVNKGPRPLSPADVDKILSDMTQPTDYMPKDIDAMLNTNDAAPHDMLNKSAFDAEPKPLTPVDINSILNDISKPTTPSAQPPKPPKAPREPVVSNSDGPIPNGPSATDFLSHVPGSVGRYAKFAKLLQSMPDATAVRNKALTGALKSTIISGMNPDSAKTKP